MRRPEAEELLRVWETGAGRSWSERAILLAALVDSDVRPHDVARMPIGDRDGRIFRLRRLLFGERLDCLTDCPRCGESLETSLSIDSIMPRLDKADPYRVPVERLTVGDHEIVFRLPNSDDLLALEAAGASQRSESQLLHGCILDVTAQGGKVQPAALSDGVLRAVTERMAEADPCADVWLELDCPLCQHRWQSSFDIVSHVWLEIEAWARRIIGDVHLLASAYGWHERDILSMTEARRRAYLDLVEA